MKWSNGVLLAIVMAVAVDANAQQRPTPIPSGGGSTSTAQGFPSHHVPVMRYPTTAARYEIYAQFLIATLRKAVGHHSISAGDIDKAVLALKDCNSSIEADGWVTRAESDYCKRVLRDKIHELAAPYLVQYAAEH